MEKGPPGKEKVWTYDDLATTPDDGQRYEIFDGELVVSPAPGLRHQEVLKRLFLLAETVLEKPRTAAVYFAPLAVILSPTRVVEPDLVVVRWDRRTTVLTPRGVEGVPDLVIEVVSPTNRKNDYTRKRRFYARNGIREYWIVDPEGLTIEVHELIDGGSSYQQAGWYAPGDIARSVQFDFAVSINELFDCEDIPD